MDVNAALQHLSGDLSSPENEQIRKALAAYLNQLLLHNFPALVQVLYRADVSEQKLKTVLQLNKEIDAGELIAALLIQRQKEKAAAAKTLFSNKQTPADDEAW